MTYHEQTYLQWVNTNFYDTLGKHWGNNPEIKYNLSVWSLLVMPNMKAPTNTMGQQASQALKLVH